MCGIHFLKSLFHCTFYAQSTNMTIRIHIFYCLLGMMYLSCSESLAPLEIQLFKNSEGEYACYRIPAIIKTQEGTLMAFAEGRKTGCSDFGNVDILLRKKANDELSKIFYSGSNKVGKF